MFNAWWNGSLCKQMRHYLFMNQLDEKQLKFLLDHTFTEGLFVGVKMLDSARSETPQQNKDKEVIEN